MEYKFRIDILSPVHIGMDNTKFWNNGLDYVVKDGKVYLLDTGEILREGGIDLNQLSAALANGDMNYLKNRIKDIKQHSKYIFNLPVSGLSQPKEIRPIIKNPLTGAPIIPGSSLKGAISSAILSHIMGYVDNPLNRNILSHLARGHNFHAEMDKFFGKPDKGSAFMRFIQVSDITFDNTSLINTKIYNLKNDYGKLSGGWKISGSHTDDRYSDNGFNTVYESLMPGQQAFGRLEINERLFNNGQYQKEFHLPSSTKIKNLLTMSGENGLFAVINSFTNEYIYKEKDFFDTYVGEHSQEISDRLYNIGCMIPEDYDDNSSCVLRMAAGSGFHSVTGDWMFEDHYIENIANIRGRSRGMKNGMKSAKSRKIAVWESNGRRVFAPMGFVKLTLI